MQNTQFKVQSLDYIGFAFTPSDHRSLGVGGLRRYAFSYERPGGSMAGGEKFGVY